MLKPTIVLIIDDNQLLLEVNKLSDKYQLSNISVKKLAAWCRMESGKRILGNNPGNMRGGSDYYIHPGAVDEYINGQHVVASGADDPLRRFRYFESLTDGIECMLLWLINKHTKAYEYLLDDSRTMAEFGFMLGSKNNYGMRYYTADQTKYASAVSSVYKTRFENL